MFSKFAIVFAILLSLVFATTANAQGSNIPEPVVEACQDQNPDVIATFEGVAYSCAEAQGNSQSQSVTLATPTAIVVAPQAVLTESGEVIIPPVLGEVTAPFAFVQFDSPVYGDSGLTQIVGTAVKHQSFPVVPGNAPAGLVAIRLANTESVYFITANAVQIAERDFVQDWALKTDEVFELGLINGCPNLEEARNIVAIRTESGESGRFALERISSEYCAYRFSGPTRSTAIAPIGAAVQFLNFAGIGTGERVGTFAMTVRFQIGLPPEDVVNANVCQFVQAAVTDALDRPASEQFPVETYNVSCPSLDRTVPTEISAAQAVAANAITIAEEEGTPNAGCPILPAGSAENETATVAFVRVQQEGWFFCLHEYNESAGLGNISFIVPEGVIIDADDGRYCPGQRVVTGGASWYWDAGDCTPSHGG